jgi:Cu(I)/Ag(I) efflux system membrane protein CusA/SilA
MIERLIAFALRHRLLVILVAAALAVFSVYTTLDTPIDALPDLSENQVIVFTDWLGHSPQEVEDQVTYPLTLKLQGLAGVRTIRATSEFNYSMITIIFEDNMDLYFARTRVLERLALASTFLPAGAVPYLAPDTTALGQIFWYTLEGGNLDPGQLWALQKYYVGPALNAVPGVAEVGIAGGLPKEYQIDVDPEVLRAFGVTLGELVEAVTRSNLAVGGRTIQKNRADYLVRGVGWIRSRRDLEDIVVKQVEGTPIYVKDLARVQVGVGYRRNVLEKDGNEVVGGVVLLRQGENPLTVLEGIRRKIQELQPSLPAGVHLVPAYDRSDLIYRAIDSLTEVLWHEMAIAALTILLILWHVRSAVVVCLTLPLSILASFLQLWLLRKLGLVDVQVNIMSLAGIAISIGILVDQAIVLVDNATHALREHFGTAPVRGNTLSLVLPACQKVGRPIFFSVLILLLSFLPVFALSGREGKLFRPMAFTKSLAMVGVALLSVTLVPALLPTFLKGRLRSEEESWLVRSFLGIYRPVLAWALPRRNLVLWLFAALLLLAAGLFPLPALLGLGAHPYYWRLAYLAVLAGVIGLSVWFIHGWHWRIVSFLSLLALGLVAYHFPKIGVAFMPALDEGTILDMPVSVPRLGLAEAVDDLKARDALLRGFPEVETVIGKAGRADTPTDPAPLEMVETFVNLRPRVLWPRRVLRLSDALRQGRAVLAALEERGYLHFPETGEAREQMLHAATHQALLRCEDALRDLANRRYREWEQQLETLLVRVALTAALRRWEQAGLLHWPAAARPEEEEAALLKELTPRYGRWLRQHPAWEDLHALCQDIARALVQRGALARPRAAPGQLQPLEVAEALEPLGSFGEQLQAQVRQTLGLPVPDFAEKIRREVADRRLQLWQRFVQERVNPELWQRAVSGYTWTVLEELARAAVAQGRVSTTPQGEILKRFVETLNQSGATAAADPAVLRPFQELCPALQQSFARWLLLWPREGSPGGDLQKELDRVVQVPGWSNIWTQPIINRIDMLSSGIRTPVGVRVFGPDLKTIERVCQQVAEVLRQVPGAENVVAQPIMGKGYLEILPDRERAARYGLTMADILDTVEVALGGKVLTQTVEGRERFPIRIRYARAFREDEEQIRRLLISPRQESSPDMSAEDSGAPPTRSGKGRHQNLPGHTSAAVPQIPLGEVAQVRLVEGPAMIPSENGQLRNYVTLTVSGNRDLASFVAEAQRQVAEKVSLPPGVRLEWAGEFEHQLRAARTLRLIFPAVLLLIFFLLYWTYRDVVDALLLLMAVPEALAGGIFFQFLFPKLLHGWQTPPTPFTVAVWIGYLAAFGMATETGVVMLVYLREAIERRGGLEKIASLEELRQAVLEGAVHRLRPKLLTETVAIVSLAPMLFSHGVGGEILSAMALPVLGGLLLADEVVDIFLPVRFYWVRRARWLQLQKDRQEAAAAAA